MAYSGKRGLQRIIKAGQYSWQGFKACYRYEAAFRQEVWAFGVAVPLAIYWGETKLEMLLMIASVLLVMIVELLNSAIEAVVDRTGSEIHKLSGRAKDMGSAAVSLSIVNALLVWGFTLF